MVFTLGKQDRNCIKLKVRLIIILSGIKDPNL